MTEIQRYVLMRLLEGWRAIADDKPWFFTMYPPGLGIYRNVIGRTTKSLFDHGWIEIGDKKKSHWRVTKLGEQALNGEPKKPRNTSRLRSWNF
jgi:hypothetical protein